MPDRIDSVSNTIFTGRVLPDLDHDNQQKYKVHIPSLMPYVDSTHGIWCHNYTAGNTTSKSQMGESGSSNPLQPGMFVMVRFKENDFTTGYIEKVISRAEKNSDTQGQDCTEPISRPEDRDRRTVLYNTANRTHTMFINEETKYEPNSVYEIYGRDGNPGRDTVRRVNEDGIHLYTRNNYRKRILLNENIQIDKDRSIYVKGNQKTNIDGEHDLTVAGDKHKCVTGQDNNYIKLNLIIETEGATHISTKNETNIYSENGSINIQSGSGSILMNCNTAFYDTAKGTRPKTEVLDLGPNETNEYKSGLGENCNNAEKSIENKGPRNLYDNTMNPEGKA